MVKEVINRTVIFDKASDFIDNSEISKHVKSIVGKTGCKNCDKDLSQSADCLYCLVGDNKEVLKDLKLLENNLTDKEFKIFLDILNNKTFKKIDENSKYNKMLYSFLHSYHYHKYL